MDLGRAYRCERHDGRTCWVGACTVCGNLLHEPTNGDQQPAGLCNCTPLSYAGHLDGVTGQPIEVAERPPARRGLLRPVTRAEVVRSLLWVSVVIVLLAARDLGLF